MDKSTPTLPPSTPPSTPPPPIPAYRGSRSCSACQSFGYTLHRWDEGSPTQPFLKEVMGRGRMGEDGFELCLGLMHG